MTKGWGQEARFAWFASWCENQTFMFVVLGTHIYVCCAWYFPIIILCAYVGRPGDCLMGLAEKLDTFPESWEDSFAQYFISGSVEPSCGSILLHERPSSPRIKRRFGILSHHPNVIKRPRPSTFEQSPRLCSGHHRTTLGPN